MLFLLSFPSWLGCCSPWLEAPQLWGAAVYGKSESRGRPGPTAICAASSVSAAAVPRSQLLWVWSFALKGRLGGAAWLMAAASHPPLRPPVLPRREAAWRLFWDLPSSHSAVAQVQAEASVPASRPRACLGDSAVNSRVPEERCHHLDE